MPFCAFSSNFALYDVTPVENLFLLEYMPYARGDYVRVYLYGLMLCRHSAAGDSLDVCARVLNLSPDKVLEAFRYWEQKGLVVRMSDQPPSFAYQNVRSAMQVAAPDDAVYVYGELNKRLEAIFGNLERRHREAAVDWVEELKLPVDVVVEMARQVDRMLTEKNGGKQRPINYAFAALKDCALDWARRDIRTVEAAHAEAQKGLPPYLAARKVLSSFNLRRNPTAAEVELAAKWLGEWDYTEQAIGAALTEVTKTANPSFAYLDGILRGQRSRTHSADAREEVKRLLEALGASSRAPTDALIESYETLLSQGFAPETILRAANLCNARGRRTFEKLTDVLSKWLSEGLTTPDAVDQYLDRRARLRKLTLTVFEKAGIEREPTDADIDQTQEWLGLAEPELIECAAERARGLSLPARSITKRLKEWAAAGIRDVEAARAFKRPGARPGTPATPGAATARNPALNYEQRNYDDRFFEAYFADVERSRRKDEA